MTKDMDTQKKIAVIVPCYNEAQSIKKVVMDFQKYLPEAEIYVFDNNSTDDTAAIARKCGAIVREEWRQGKGFVVKRMFRDVDADIYVMIDGDDTYPVDRVRDLVDLVKKGADVVVGDRLTNGTYTQENKRRFHNVGNVTVRAMINRLFRVQLHDIMSGYRAFSRDFVKSYPVLCDGFQIEVDMTIFALDHHFVIKEVPVTYRDRAVGSVSKLRTIPDGVKVIMTIFNLYRHFRPLVFFGAISITCFVIGMIVGLPVIREYVENVYINKVPSAILASAMVMLSVLFASIGIILDAVRRIGREQFEVRRMQC